MKLPYRPLCVNSSKGLNCACVVGSKGEVQKQQLKLEKLKKQTESCEKSNLFILSKRSAQNIDEKTIDILPFINKLMTKGQNSKVPCQLRYSVSVFHGVWCNQIQYNGIYQTVLCHYICAVHLLVQHFMFASVEVNQSLSLPY